MTIENQYKILELLRENPNGFSLCRICDETGLKFQEVEDSLKDLCLDNTLEVEESSGTRFFKPGLNFFKIMKKSGGNQS